MIRRLASLLVISLGLISVTVPAAACESLMQHGACCPTQQGPPCSECPAPQPGDSGPSLCVSMPVAAVAAAIPAGQDETASLDASGAAGIPPSSAYPELVAAQRPPATAPHALPPGAAPTIYLVTGRLRL